LLQQHAVQIPNEMHGCNKDFARHLLYSNMNQAILPVVNQKVSE
jgi:hypothetical protein